MMGSKISEEELNKVLSTEGPKEKVDPKKKWVDRMLKSASKYHKICPYYDKKTGNCFIKQLKFMKSVKCDRDGKFEGCPVLISYLEEKYDWFKQTGQPIPMDFRDLTLFA
jgi:hypothetical protein